MIFNRVNFQKLLEQTHEGVFSNKELLDGLSITLKNDKDGINVAKGSENFSISVGVNFQSRIVNIWFNRSWSASEEILNIYRFYYFTLKKYLEESGFDCFLSTDSLYTIDSDLNSNTIYLYEKEVLPIGDISTKFYHLLANMNISSDYRFIFLNDNVFDDGNMKVFLNYDKECLQFVFESNDTYDDHPELAYLLYEIFNEEDYKQYKREVEYEKKLKEDLFQELSLFIYQINPSFKTEIEKDHFTIRLFDDFENISIVRDLLNDEPIYQVYGFCSDIRTQDFNEILSFLKNDFTIFLELLHGRIEIIDYIKQYDSEAFFLQEANVTNSAYEFYSSILDSKLRVSVSFRDYQEKKYHYKIENLKYNDYRSEEISSNDFSSLNELIKDLKDKLNDLLQVKRMDNLFSDQHYPHYAKIYHLFNFSDWNEVKISTSLSKELINKELRNYFKENDMTRYFKTNLFLKIGKLYFYKNRKNIHIVDSEDALLNLFMDKKAKAQ
jgi:hypothetical protein